MPSLRQIRYFIAAAEAQKITSAASTLSISQSAITIAIQELETELGDQLPPIFGNQVQLQQVILNLVMNAIDAMRSVPERVLSITTTSDGHDGVRVSIADTGVGIDPAEADRIFKPLFTTKERGMGMGLSICRTIVESHNGRIWVSAGRERGAVFQLVLPTDGRRT